MAVDYLSTLNSGGSGLNITQLVDSIVAAEIEPAKALINKQVSENDLAISEVAKFRARAATLEGALSVAGATGIFQVQSSSAATAIAVTDMSALETGSMSVKTNQLATRQVLEFEGFASLDATIPAGNLTIETGSWSANNVFTTNPDGTAQTVTIANGGTSLSEFSNVLNALSGVTAQVIAKGDGTFSLSVMSEYGAENALRLTASSGGPTDFDTTDGGNEITSAQDAELIVNGITISRETNTISDIVAGTTLTLNEVTTSNVNLTVATNLTTAKADLQALIDQINTMRSYLAAATARGANGTEPGALAGDASISAIKRELSSITTAPLNGFGDNPVYLSEVGVKTNRDGSLSLDETQLETILINNPEKLDAIYNSLNAIELDTLEVSFSSNATPPEGVHSFAYDAASDTATLNEISLSSRINSAGAREFYKIGGTFSGLVINAGNHVQADGDLSTKVYVGQSLVDKLSTYLETITATSGDITKKETYLNARSSEYKEQLTEAETKADIIQARELRKFAEMEKAVTQLKSTGDYITTLMDAWAKES
ncbi:flagellar filament capping protein FliD [Planktomarina temperata]|nr:flagellar filament capping protein FliD [Planktomarina temperata]